MLAHDPVGSLHLHSPAYWDAEFALLGGDRDFTISEHDDMCPQEPLEWLEDAHHREEHITDELENMVDFITQEATAEIIGGAESSVSIACGAEGLDASVSYRPGGEWHATKQALRTSLCTEQVRFYLCRVSNAHFCLVCNM
jgi:hypothetical protein